MTSTTQSAGIVTFEQASETVAEYCRHIPAPSAAEVPLLAALGRVLAEPVLADRDFPPFHRATRDGYAVRAADVTTTPARLRVVGQIKAGASLAGRVNSGEAAEIMTGAAVPEGADAVVMVEYTSLEGKQAEIRRAVAAGENVVPAGAEARAGRPMLPVGQRLGPPQIAMAAACGAARVRVFDRPRVAILATGDELVELADTPGPHQIRNSNSYSLAAQIEAVGGEAVRLPVAPDEPRKLATLLCAGLAGNNDMLLVSGGVSAGKFDLVEQALKDLGAVFFFTGVQIQPGRPVVFGEIRFSHERNGRGDGSAQARAASGAGAFSKSSNAQPRNGLPFFGLPGNPVSTMVTFDLFARPVLQALSGATATRLPSARARLNKDVKTKTGLTRFLPAILEGGLNDPQVEAIAWQGSGDLLASARANCYLVVPPDRERMAAGEMISILLR